MVDGKIVRCDLAVCFGCARLETCRDGTHHYCWHNAPFGWKHASRFGEFTVPTVCDRIDTYRTITMLREL